MEIELKPDEIEFAEIVKETITATGRKVHKCRCCQKSS
jgi:hypothetical protein